MLDRVVYYDITLYCESQRENGIWRTTAEILRYLSSILEGEYRIVCIASDPDKTCTYYAMTYTCTGKWIKGEQIIPKPGDIYLGVYLNAESVVKNKDLFRAWRLRGVFTAIVLYDLVYELFPETVSSTYAVKILGLWLRLITKEASLVLAISKAVYDEVIDWSIKFEHEIQCDLTWFYLGSDFSKNFERSSVSQTNRNSCSKFLSVSTIEPRKGYLDLVMAFEKVLDRGVDAQLTIVGRLGWKGDEIERAIKGSKYFRKNIFWLSNASDGDLLKAYQNADCFIFSSYYEGFGLPIIEASNNNLRLILRDIPVFREIAGQGAEYFSSVDELSELIEQHVKHPRIKKMPLLVDLSWKESTQMLWDQIQEHLKGQSNNSCQKENFQNIQTSKD